ncbi:MAG: DNA-binding protein [Candidatus Rokuibacteriota bacterium]|nr:MAG: DNA-binding protein [Candidatus Rokubacteria bacterium]
MKPEAGAEGLRWLRQAERDLDDAEYNLAGDRHSLVCFLCQQAAEKALKAVLYAQGAEQVLGHSVAELAGACAEVDRAFEPLARKAAPLDQYYVPTRYPNSLPGGIPAEAFDASDAERALALCREVLKTARARIGEASGRDR